MMHRPIAILASLAVLLACSSGEAFDPRTVKPPSTPSLTVTGATGPLDPVNNSASPLSVGLVRQPPFKVATYTLTATASGASSGAYTYSWFVQDCYASYCTAMDVFAAGDGLSSVTYSPPAGAVESRAQVQINETGSPSYYTKASGAVYMRGPQWGVGTTPNWPCSSNSFPFRERIDTMITINGIPYPYVLFPDYSRDVCTGAKKRNPAFDPLTP